MLQNLNMYDVRIKCVARNTIFYSLYIVKTEQYAKCSIHTLYISVHWLYESIPPKESWKNPYSYFDFVLKYSLVSTMEAFNSNDSKNGCDADRVMSYLLWREKKGGNLLWFCLAFIYSTDQAQHTVREMLFTMVEKKISFCLTKVKIKTLHF